MLLIETSGFSAQPDDREVLKLIATGRGALAFLLGDADSRFRLFSGRINWDRVFLARADGCVVGFLAFQWQKLGPYSPTLCDFFREFGRFPGVWRWLLFCFLEMRTWRRGFYIYGLKVLPGFRRQGVASALLQAAETHAVTLAAPALELDVHDENVRAQKFYEASGFVVRDVWRLGLMSRLTGFSAVLRLIKRLC